MRITRVESTVLRLPAARAVSLPVNGSPIQRTAERFVLAVHLHTDTGQIGLGFGVFANGVRGLAAVIEDDLTPLLVGAEPLNHERLLALARSIEAPGANSAYALIDIALWDLKAKTAGLPLWRLLGGVRERVPVHCADTAAPDMSGDDVIAVGRAALRQGIKGVRIGLTGIDPEADASKAQTVRDALGEDIWFGVCAGGRYDYETALPMGRFIEEEIGADWFEDPLADDDVASYSRLSQRIDTPLAAGSRFTSAAQFIRLLESGARATLRPDVLRLGGLTTWLKVAAHAELVQRPIVPHLLPEIGVHLACGLPGVQAVDYTSLLTPLFVSGLQIEDGYIVPPQTPGLGLEFAPDALARFRVGGK